MDDGEKIQKTKLALLLLKLSEICVNLCESIEN